MSNFAIIRKRSRYVVLLQGLAVLFLLYSTSFYNFVLFHTLAELATIVIAFGIFVVAWNFHKFQENNFILILGVAYFFVALLDLLHVLSYKGIVIFENTSNLPTQLWIATRYLESLSFLAAFFFLNRRIRFRGDSVFLFFLTITSLIALSIFSWNIFPAAYVEGMGLTEFKILSEYIIVFFFLGAIGLLWANCEKFDKRFAQFLGLALFAKIGSEIFFTQYFGVYDFANLTGHLLKVFSFFMLYKAVLDVGLTDPYNVLFRDLKKSEENYRHLVDNSLVGIYRLNKEGNYTYVNKAMARMFEFGSSEEMIRENVKMRYKNPAEREKFLKLIKEKGRLSNYEIEGMTKSGRRIVVLAAVTLIEDEIAGMVVDITAKREAEEELKKAAEEWNMTFSSISDPIFILDLNHAIIKANRALLDFLGKSEKEIVGKKCYEVVHKQNRAWPTCPLSITRQTGESHTEEVEDPAVGKVLLVTTSPIRNSRGRITGVAHIAKDITERKYMEKAKDEFVSLASHQLRTPLSSIALSSELLLRGVAGDVGPGQKEYLEEINKATKRMTLLVNNLLNVSRVEMGNFEVQPGPFDIVSAVRSVVKEFLPLARDKKLEVKMDIGENILSVNLDEKSFGLIFDNLLSNAIRYTLAEGEISVSLEKNPAGILLAVADTGLGIPAGQKKKIFQKSFRAANAREVSSEGAGLGLYMARIAAEKSGAKIRFDSEEGKGTTFFVQFPE